MIEIRDLHKSFGSHQVLRGVDLLVEDGQSMVVIGGSGSGKSVLMKHIIGLLKPDKGSVLVDGTDITRLDAKHLYEVRKKFGMLFQGAALFDSMAVWENVSFALLRSGMRASEARQVAIEKLRLVGLTGIEDLMPSELSGGMRKRVGLARAIAHQPQILLYDEPTTGIDPIMGDVINDLIIKMREDLLVTSVAITHDMHSAYKIADRIAFLYEGRIVETGTPEGIRNTTNPLTKQFITGSSQGPIKIEGINA
ncbi:MAG: ABC transporter ATP-binding protein [Nitrospiraceae bacterium]|nr:ABC transporter ATP-binding protein [Nitrospiraceae bacterium]